jgi:hypothetical protein
LTASRSISIAASTGSITFVSRALAAARWLALGRGTDR